MVNINKRKLNILMVTEGIYPDKVGGSYTYIYNLAKRLVRGGHQVFVITKKVAPSALTYETIEGIRVIRYDVPLRKNPLFILEYPLMNFLGAYKKFRELLKSQSLDLIDFHLPFPSFAINLALAFNRKIGKIYTFHSPTYQEILLDKDEKQYLPPILFQSISAFVFPLVKFIERFSLRRCHKVLVLSEYTKRITEKLHGIPSEKVFVIPSGVDMTRFRPSEDKYEIRKKLGLPVDKKVFFTVRRLTKRMGLENLLYAIKKVVVKEKNIFFVIGGEGPLRERLEDLAEKLGIDAFVTFKGFITDSDLVSYYQAADCFILPTEQLEGFGIVTVEALSCGLPVLGTPVGGTVEILGNLNRNFLLKGTSPDDLVEGILAFLGGRIAEGPQEEKIRDYVKSFFSWEEVIGKIEDLFYSVVKPKRIGIDARMLQATGIGRYIRNLLKELPMFDPEDTFVFFMKKGDHDELELNFPNIEKRTVNAHWFTLSEQIQVPLAIKKAKIDFMHFPHFNIPVFWRGPFLVTIHDLILTHFSTQRDTLFGPLIYLFKRAGYHLAMKLATLRAEKIVTVAEDVKKELNDHFNLPEEKIEVIYEACDQRFLEALNRKEKLLENEKRLRSQYKIDKPFLLYVGNAYPHKNLPLLLNVFQKLIFEEGRDIKLVLVGRLDYFFKRLQDRTRKLKLSDKIIFTDFISDELLPSFYAASMAYILPSLMEGFGIPPLEAMACGIPVIASNASSIPEVCGKAALYFDSSSEEDLKEKILELMDSSDLREKLRKEGFRRVTEFSWKKMAKETLGVYRGVENRFSLESLSKFNLRRKAFAKPQ